MPTSNQLAGLAQQHRMLENELAEALQHPSVGDFTLAELKRRKLQLKDEMARVAHLERDCVLRAAPMPALIT
jgi:hypothetical protein